MTELLPPGIRDDHHLALQPLLERFQGLNLVPLLVDLVDQVGADVLPYLAEQYAVLGFGGWDLVRTESERRELIKNAMELHRFKGTPWALRHALALVGWPGAVLRERVGTGPDGWAFFEVRYDIGEREVRDEDLRNIAGVIDEWKPVSRILAALSMRLVLPPASAVRPPSRYGEGGTHNGRILHDGEALGELQRIRVSGAFEVPVTAREPLAQDQVLLRFDIPHDVGVGVDCRVFELVDPAGVILARAERASILKTSAFALAGEWPITLLPLVGSYD